MKQLTIISLGWGVQSWTLAAMSALGELPSVDYAIHSDTTFERTATYAFAKEWTPWLEERGVKVVTVSDPRATNITKKSSTSDGTYTLMPVFTRNDDGSRGQLRRQCTSRWKIEPLQRWLGEELKRRGLKKTGGATRHDGVVQQWLGITKDEFLRAKDSQMDWISNSYPLLDRMMSRDDCLAWLKAHNLPSPGKSACVQCMFHSRAYWQQMKQEGGADWENAVKADIQLRETTGREWFLHSDRKPLEDAVILKSESAQTWMFDDDNEPECDSGHCFL